MEVPVMEKPVCGLNAMTFNPQIGFSITGTFNNGLRLFVEVDVF